MKRDNMGRNAHILLLVGAALPAAIWAQGPIGDRYAPPYRQYYQSQPAPEPKFYPGYLTLTLPSSTAVVRIRGVKIKGTGVTRSYYFTDLKPGETRLIAVQVDQEKGNDLLRAKFEINLTYGKPLETLLDFSQAEVLDAYETYLAEQLAEENAAREIFAKEYQKRLTAEPQRITDWYAGLMKQLRRSPASPSVAEAIERTLRNEATAQNDRILVATEHFEEEIARRQTDFTEVNDDLWQQYLKQGTPAVPKLRAEGNARVAAVMKRATIETDHLNTELNELALRREAFGLTSEIDRETRIEKYVTDTLRPWYDEALKTYQLSQGQLHSEHIAPLQKQLDAWNKQQQAKLRKVRDSEDEEVLVLAHEILSLRLQNSKRDIATAERSLNKVLSSRKDYARLVYDEFMRDFRATLSVTASLQKQKELKAANEMEIEKLLAVAKDVIAQTDLPRETDPSVIELAKRKLENVRSAP